MRIIVTGGAGYIGSVTARRLLDSGHEVIVFDSLERGHRQAVDTRAAFVEGDLRDREAVTRVMCDVRPEAVMHFAAYALVAESMEKPELYFGNNVVGAVNLTAAMLRAGVGRLVFSSTCATYGQPSRVPITEAMPQNPTNPYGESKLMVERILDWHHRVHGLLSVSLRYFNACGAAGELGEDHEPETHIIPIVLQAAMGQRERVNIYGDDYDTPDGSCVRDYVHILDLAEAHILALSCKEPAALNLGTGRGYSVKEVVETARRVTGHAIPAETAPRRPGDPARLVASADKATQHLEWRPRFTDLEEIIESAWQWHSAHPHGYSA